MTIKSKVVVEIEMKNMMEKDQQDKIITEDLQKMMIHGTQKVSTNLKIPIQVLAVRWAEVLMTTKEEEPMTTEVEEAEAEEAMTTEEEEVEVVVDLQKKKVSEEVNIVIISQGILKMIPKKIVFTQLKNQISKLMLMIIQTVKIKITTIHIAEEVGASEEVVTQIVKEKDVVDKNKVKVKVKEAVVEVEEDVVEKEVDAVEEVPKILPEIHIIKEIKQPKRQVCSE